MYINSQDGIISNSLTETNMEDDNMTNEVIPEESTSDDTTPSFERGYSAREVEEETPAPSFAHSEKTEIKISEIKELLSSGYTRLKSTKGYDPSIGSIQEYYNLEPGQVRLMFKAPALKGLKTKQAPAFTLIDDTQDETSDSNS